MSTDSLRKDVGLKIASVIAFALVVIGMVNNIPAIPGLDDWVKTITGDPFFSIRKFPYEYFHPFYFLLMMIVVVLHHSMWRAAVGRSPMARRVALFMDIAMVAMSVAIVGTYLIEIDSICLIDRLTGERAALIDESLRAEIEFAKLYGLPIPSVVEDPQCLNTTGVWIILVMTLAIIIFLAYNVKVWGLPLVLVAIGIAAYTLVTVLIWYFWGADEMNKYVVTKLGGEPRMLIDGRPTVQDILVNNSQGLLGRFLDILVNTVFPYIILGGLFSVSAGGKSMIKLAFVWTRRLRGGPAHAAIVSSAMFGTISGGPVVNVLSTGVLTIPMMLKRGFSKTFAGGVEAAASSGGSIMPPVMGVAAFILASLTLVPYREVIIAAVIPALAYFGCLFLSVVFQARKQGIAALGEVTEEMRMSRADWLSLITIFGPILLILFFLLTPKEAIGCGPIGAMLGIEQIITDGACRALDLPWLLKLVQNSAGDAGSAGWWAVMLLLVLVFADRQMRAKPGLLVDAIINSGVMISTLYLMFLAVSIIDFCLNFTGLSSYVALDVLSWLNGLAIGAGGEGLFMFLALAATMVLAVLLGMGMPTVPAYINVALLMGPILSGLGIATFTAHMFIFYFAVASAITPPVAIAAFAASSITKADPMATGFSAVRSGIVMFVIPFVFAFYPELLLIEAAVLDPTGRDGSFLSGYDGAIHVVPVAALICRTMIALYLLASALARHDVKALSMWEVGLRLLIALAILWNDPVVYLPGIAGFVLLVGRQYGPTIRKR